MIEIETYAGMHDEEIIALILKIQNEEAKIHLSLAEQPDLKDIQTCYQKDGGEFWIAKSDGKVIGTLGLQLRENHCAVMKKFFVDCHYRSQKIGLALYQKLLAFAKDKGVRHIILDTPSVARALHKFYEMAGFHRICTQEFPIRYLYPDRDSLLYMLDL